VTRELGCGVDRPGMANNRKEERMEPSICARNDIEKCAELIRGTELGSHNRVGPSVVIGGFKGTEQPRITIGTCTPSLAERGSSFVRRA